MAPWSPLEFGVDPIKAMSADTLLVVDVDGVLNVGAKDEEGGPLMLMNESIEDAKKLWSTRSTHPMQTTIERLVAIANRRVDHGEGETYQQLASKSKDQVSDVLVGRLAKLIRAAGDRCLVILSSRWKKTVQRVQRLEKRISKHLQAPFKFDGKTGPETKSSPEVRLESIGDFLDGFWGWRGIVAGPLRTVILEDFHISALNGWSVGGHTISSTADAEEYLLNRLGCLKSVLDMRLKLVHTYEEWDSSEGHRVQLGAGLNMKFFCKAAQALGRGCEYCGRSGTTTVSSTAAKLQTGLASRSSAVAAAALTSTRAMKRTASTQSSSGTSDASTSASGTATPTSTTSSTSTPSSSSSSSSCSTVSASAASMASLLLEEEGLAGQPSVKRRRLGTGHNNNNKNNLNSNNNSTNNDNDSSCPAYAMMTTGTATATSAVASKSATCLSSTRTTTTNVVTSTFTFKSSQSVSHPTAAAAHTLSANDKARLLCTTPTAAMAAACRGSRL